LREFHKESGGRGDLPPTPVMKRPDQREIHTKALRSRGLHRVDRLDLRKKVTAGRGTMTGGQRKWGRGWKQNRTGKGSPPVVERKARASRPKSKKPRPTGEAKKKKLKRPE